MRNLELEKQHFHVIEYMSSGPGGVPQRRNLECFRAFVDELPEGVEAMVAASDLQGRDYKDDRFGTLIGVRLAEELKALEELGEIPTIGLVLLAGDLYDYPDCRKVGGTGPVEDVWNAFAERFPRVIGVHGNHDQASPELMAENTRVLDGKTTFFQSMLIGGVSGIIGRKSKNQRQSPEDFLRKLGAVLNKNPDILLLHAGPDEPGTGRIGDSRIREVLERRGRAGVYFGHCHWKVPLAMIGRNQVVNVDGRVLLLTCAE